MSSANETLQQPSIEQQPTPESRSAIDMLQQDEATKWVRHQQSQLRSLLRSDKRTGFGNALLGEERKFDNKTQLTKEYFDTIDTNLDAYLASEGVSRDDEQYDMARTALREGASLDVLARNHDALDNPAHAWYVGSKTEDGTERTSGMSQFNEAVAPMREAMIARELQQAEGVSQPTEEAQPPVVEGDQSETGSDQTETEQQPQPVSAVEQLQAMMTPESYDNYDLEQLKGMRENAREDWATFSAKQQGRVFNYKKMHGYNAAKQTYEAISLEIAKRELADVVADEEMSRDAKIQAIDTHYVEEQNALRTLTKEKLEGTHVGRLVKWLNKGGKVTRLAKGVGVGVAAGSVGALAGGIVGAAAAGTAVVGATRLFRGYAAGERNKRGMSQVDTLTLEIDANTIDSEPTADENLVLDQRSQLWNERFKHDTKHEQRKRRRSVRRGIGMVAAGSVIGAAGMYALDNMNDMDLYDKWSIGDRFQGIKDKTKDIFSISGDDAGETPSGDSGNGAADTKSPESGADGAATGASEAMQKMLDKTFTVGAGDGYTHVIADFAKEAGVELKAGEAEKIHEYMVDKIGRDYIDINGAGNDVYSMGSGKYEIGLTESGNATWSTDAKKALAEYMTERQTNVPEVVENKVDTVTINPDTDTSKDIAEKLKGFDSNDVVKGMPEGITPEMVDSYASETDLTRAEAYEKFLTPTYTDVASWVKAGTLEKLNSLSQQDIESIAKLSNGLTYEGSDVELVEKVNGEWRFNNMPKDAKMPKTVLDQLSKLSKEVNYSSMA